MVRPTLWSRLSVKRAGMPAPPSVSRFCRWIRRSRSRAPSRSPDPSARVADWLTAQPIAHRGLHDAAAGIVENTSSAVAAAIAGDYGIEVDLQITCDGDAVVHHDGALGRLTDGEGQLNHLTSAEL